MQVRGVAVTAATKGPVQRSDEQSVHTHRSNRKRPLHQLAAAACKSVACKPQLPPKRPVQRSDVQSVQTPRTTDRSVQCGAHCTRLRQQHASPDRQVTGCHQSGQWGPHSAAACKVCKRHVQQTVVCKLDPLHQLAAAACKSQLRPLETTPRIRAQCIPPCATDSDVQRGGPCTSGSSSMQARGVHISNDSPQHQAPLSQLRIFAYTACSTLTTQQGATPAPPLHPAHQLTWPRTVFQQPVPDGHEQVLRRVQRLLGRVEVRQDALLGAFPEQLQHLGGHLHARLLHARALGHHQVGQRREPVAQPGHLGHAAAAEKAECAGTGSRPSARRRTAGHAGHAPVRPHDHAAARRDPVLGEDAGEHLLGVAQRRDREPHAAHDLPDAAKAESQT